MNHNDGRLELSQKYDWDPLDNGTVTRALKAVAMSAGLPSKQQKVLRSKSMREYDLARIVVASIGVGTLLGGIVLMVSRMWP